MTNNVTFINPADKFAESELSNMLTVSFPHIFVKEAEGQIEFKGIPIIVTYSHAVDESANEYTEKVYNRVERILSQSPTLLTTPHEVVGYLEANLPVSQQVDDEGYFHYLRGSSSELSYFEREYERAWGKEYFTALFLDSKEVLLSGKVVPQDVLPELIQWFESCRM